MMQIKFVLDSGFFQKKLETQTQVILLNTLGTHSQQTFLCLIYVVSILCFPPSHFVSSRKSRFTWTWSASLHSNHAPGTNSFFDLTSIPGLQYLNFLFFLFQERGPKDHLCSVEPALIAVRTIQTCLLSSIMYA